jgi:hypothetical protein
MRRTLPLRLREAAAGMKSHHIPCAMVLPWITSEALLSAPYISSISASYFYREAGGGGEEGKEGAGRP